MRSDEVPQDGRPEYGGERRAVYAVDPAGRYTTVPSAGWRADEIVNQQAVDEYRRLALEALARVRAGAAAPLEFHMYDRRMEVESLAPAAGFWRWRVRRHLRPDVFARLPAKILRRYADALGLGIETLKSVPARDAPP